MQVILSVAVSPDEIYAQLSADSDKLQSLTERLQAACSTNAQRLPIDSVYLGVACAAKYSADNTYYRCVPVTINGDAVKVRQCILIN